MSTGFWGGHFRGSAWGKRAVGSAQRAESGQSGGWRAESGERRAESGEGYQSRCPAGRRGSASATRPCRKPIVVRYTLRSPLSPLRSPLCALRAANCALGHCDILRPPMPATRHIERHFTASDMVRDVVIGMADGLTVPFALAAGLSGAVASTGIVVTAGLAEIAAGSIAMGLGGYLAAKSDADHYHTEKEREEQ